ncbi:ATP-binding protein [Streptomyces djakartensis]|uniref:Histidine kinase/HSP90-like ATPase domain-containing protein n=1 Tax=Streptomyces djakartensis TaxID=68193 RepID=A0ABQ2ZD33_9ACTN|nr:ATP-binding protein [Streptomyces djakartensis]GGY12828.1 hypothetical protein GCM10010384_17860 [Streptomyces djakartensis]
MTTFRKAPTYEDRRGCCSQRLPAGSAQAAIRDFEVTFAPADERVWHMRRITAAHLRHWDLTALSDTAILAVSELVTNAVRHCRGEAIAVRVVILAEELRIEVTDGNPAPARRRKVGLDAESGRGLLLVATLAKEWGVSPDGTMTWCSLAIPSPDARCAETQLATSADSGGCRATDLDELPVSALAVDQTFLPIGTP